MKTQFEQKSDFEKLVIAQHYINFLKKENKKLETERGGLLSEIEHVDYLESEITKLKNILDKKEKSFKSLKKYYTLQAEENSGELLAESMQRQKEHITSLQQRITEHNHLFKLCKKMKQVVHDVLDYHELNSRNNEESVLYLGKRYDRMVETAKEADVKIKELI